MFYRLTSTVIVISLTAQFSFANQCESYLLVSKKTNEINLSTFQEMIQNHLIYSPWYYDALKSGVDEDDIKSALKNYTQTDIIKLTSHVFNSLIMSKHIKFDLEKNQDRYDVIISSIHAIRNSGIFPVLVRTEVVTTPGNKQLSKTLYTLSGIAAISALPITYYGGYSFAAMPIVVAGFFYYFAPRVGLENQVVKYKITPPEAIEEFVLSEGEIKNSDFETYFTVDESGQILVGPQYNIRLDSKGFVEIYIPSGS